MRVKYPVPIDAGATIGVWAPSSPAPHLFPRRFDRACRHLEAAGFHVIPGASCRDNQRFDAGFAQRLADEFHSTLADSQIDAVWFASGGLSTNVVLDYIDWQLVRSYAKPIVGYSDATSFLLAAYARAGLVTFHGPMVVSEWGELGDIWDYSRAGVLSALSANYPIRFEPAAEWTDELLWWDKEDIRRRHPTGTRGWRWWRAGTSSGPLLGGNLETLCLLAGTPNFPDLAGAILFVEGDGLSPDRFLALMTQLRQAGCLDDIHGFITGRHARPRPSSGGQSSFDPILEHLFADRNIPILLDVDLGHTEPMLTIPIGGQAQLDSAREAFAVGGAGSPAVPPIFP